MSRFSWSLLGLIVAGCAGLDATTPRKISASPTPTAVSLADLGQNADIPATGSPLASTSANTHPLIVRRAVRFAGLTVGADDRWYTPWFDLKEGAATSSLYPVRAIIRCTITNMNDYLLGKPGAKTCSAGFEGSASASYACAPCGLNGKPGDFDARNEAFAGASSYGSRWPMGDFDDVYVLRFGSEGPDANYAKLRIDAGDVTAVGNYVDVTWAFQTAPGVRVLDLGVATGDYLRDSVPPTPTPAPTPTPTPTRRPPDSNVEKKTVKLKWVLNFNNARNVAFAYSDRVSLSDGATKSHSSGIAGLATPSIQFVRRIRDNFPDDPWSYGEFPGIDGFFDGILGTPGSPLNFQRFCGETAPLEIQDAPTGGWGSTKGPKGEPYLQGAFYGKEKCEIGFNIGDGIQGYFGKILIVEAADFAENKPTAPLSMALWINTKRDSRALE